MSKPNKDARPTPRLPRGLRDIEAAELRQQYPLKHAVQPNLGSER